MDTILSFRPRHGISAKSTLLNTLTDSVPEPKNQNCRRHFFVTVRGAKSLFPLTNLGFCPNQEGGGGADRIPTFL